MITNAPLLLWTIGGTCVASLLALVPALHIYNVAGLLLLLRDPLAPYMSSEELAFLFLGLVTGYTINNTIPSIFLSVPDESSIFIVLPGQKYMLQRRGYEAVVLSGIGSLGGLGILVLLTPIATRIIPPIREILTPHLSWILWSIIAYMLLSEWPKATTHGKAGWSRWWASWKSLSAGLATFLLSGLLGLILMYRPLVPKHVSYQNLLPAFIGLFALPWIIQNLLARTDIPVQHIASSVDAPFPLIVQGTAAGVWGGLFAAFFPIVTGGIGGFLAGHATAQRDERAFIISQGASKFVYYVGGFLLFFTPGVHLTRGGMAWMLSTEYTPYTPEVYYYAVAAIVIAGVLAFFLSLGLTRGVILVLEKLGYRRISWLTLPLLLSLIIGITGVNGVLISAVATGIGLIPVLWGSRRMNAMGVLLLPIGLNMIGLGDEIAALLGLL